MTIAHLREHNSARGLAQLLWNREPLALAAIAIVAAAISHRNGFWSAPGFVLILVGSLFAIGSLFADNAVHPARDQVAAALFCGCVGLGLLRPAVH
jgi:hypothetical protein